MTPQMTPPMTLATGYRRKRLSERNAVNTDRRRAERFEQSRPVAVYEPYVSRFFGGQTLDVSVSGMKLRLPGWVKLRAGRIVDLHAGTEAGGLPLANRRRAMLCRVVWSQAGDDHVTVGVEFLSSISAEAA